MVGRTDGCTEIALIRSSASDGSGASPYSYGEVMPRIRSATVVTMLAAGLLLAAGGTAAAQAFDIDSTDITTDKPAIVQDVAETSTVEDIQVGLVNVQDVANANQVNALNQNQINPVSAENANVGWD